MDSTQPIRGKIAAIITASTVLINRGREHGITSDMTFTVVLEVPKIPDPDNPMEFLPGPRFRKARLRVASIGDKASLCFIVPGSAMQEVSDTTAERPPVQPPLVKTQDWIIRVGDTVWQEKPRAPAAAPERPASP